MSSAIPEPLAGLRGLRLALYDEALAAGPLGIGRADLLARVAEEAQRMGLQPAMQLRDLEWLASVRLFEEIRPGFYRARRKEAAVLDCGMRNADCGVKKGEAEPDPKPETRNLKPAAPTPAMVASQLRTPIFAPRQDRGGQRSFF